MAHKISISHRPLRLLNIIFFIVIEVVIQLFLNEIIGLKVSATTSNSYCEVVGVNLLLAFDDLLQFLNSNITHNLEVLLKKSHQFVCHVSHLFNLCNLINFRWFQIVIILVTLKIRRGTFGIRCFDHFF